MNQETPKAKTKVNNTQSVRLPMDLYEVIANMAIKDEVAMNTVILRLIKFGLQQQVNFEQAVREFVFRRISPKEAEKLAHGDVPAIHS